MLGTTRRVAVVPTNHCTDSALSLSLQSDKINPVFILIFCFGCDTMYLMNAVYAFSFHFLLHICGGDSGIAQLAEKRSLLTPH